MDHQRICAVLLETGMAVRRKSIEVLGELIESVTVESQGRKVIELSMYVALEWFCHLEFLGRVHIEEGGEEMGGIHRALAKIHFLRFHRQYHFLGDIRIESLHQLLEICMAD